MRFQTILYIINSQNVVDLCLNVDDGEENVIVMKIDQNMTREDVLTGILEKIWL